MQPEVMIVGGARTPMTDYVGALKDISALELGAIAARGAFERTGVKPEWVDHVVVGNVLQTSADAIYGARHVALKAGVPIEVPALTVNRLCGSGIQAAVSGAQLIQLGEAGMVLTGGIESMSQAPHVIRGLRGGLKLGQGKLEDALWEALVDTHCGCSMAITAENCACRYGISRKRAGRIRTAKPAAGRSRLDRWPARRRGRAGRDQDAQGRRDGLSRRSHAARDDDGRAGEAAGRVQERRLRHRRQRERDRRRRRRADSGVARSRRSAWRPADRQARGLGRGRRRAGLHGHGSGARNPRGPEAQLV